MHRNNYLIVASLLCLGVSLGPMILAAQTPPTGATVGQTPSSTAAPARPTTDQPSLIRIEPAGPLRLESDKAPGWSYWVPVVGPVISGFLAFLGAWAGLRIAQRNTLRTVEVARETSEASIWQKANETELQDIQTKLDKFYGPFAIRLKMDHQFAQDLRSRQPAGYRMLVQLFDRTWIEGLSAGDKKLVELVCESAGVLERLIADNAGSMDEELIEYFSRASAHFRILQLAFKGELGTDPARFMPYVYPRQLDGVLRTAVKRLNRRAEALRANPSASPGPMEPLILSEEDALDKWPDPDQRIHPGEPSKMRAEGEPAPQS